MSNGGERAGEARQTISWSGSLVPEPAAADLREPEWPGAAESGPEPATGPIERVELAADTRSAAGRGAPDPAAPAERAAAGPAGSAAAGPAAAEFAESSSVRSAETGAPGSTEPAAAAGPVESGAEWPADAGAPRSAAGETTSRGVRGGERTAAEPGSAVERGEPGEHRDQPGAQQSGMSLAELLEAEDVGRAGPAVLGGADPAPGDSYGAAGDWPTLERRERRSRPEEPRGPLGWIRRRRGE